MTLPDLPANVGFGTVIGRFFVAEEDTIDVGSDPNASAAVGSVTFTPSVDYLLNSGAMPDPVMIFLQPVTVDLDANGYIVDGQGAPGVKLVATDDADLDPTGWTWNASFDLVGGHTIAAFDFALPEGTTVNLTTVIPQQGSTGLIASVRQDSEGSVQILTKLTQAEYDAIPTPDPFTLYAIIPE